MPPPVRRMLDPGGTQGACKSSAISTRAPSRQGKQGTVVRPWLTAAETHQVAALSKKVHLRSVNGRKAVQREHRGELLHRAHRIETFDFEIGQGGLLVLTYGCTD
jgi:hypothetical protein